MSNCKPELGMSINIWGPAAWSFLQTSAFAYGKNPEQATVDEQERATAFFTALPYMLPCSVCRQHYLEHIQEMPPDVKNRDSLSRWVVKLHNRVNKSTGKEEIPYEKVREHYMGGRQFLSADTEDSAELCELRSKAQISEYINYTLGFFLFISALTLIVMFSSKKK